eukprot:4087122-Pyramimonas_sp.AAC.1
MAQGRRIDVMDYWEDQPVRQCNCDEKSTQCKVHIYSPSQGATPCRNPGAYSVLAMDRSLTQDTHQSMQGID